MFEKRLGWFVVAMSVAAMIGQHISLPAPSPPPAPAGFTIAEQMPPTYLAYTQCSQMGDSMVVISWVRTEVLDTEQENPIVSHELVHQEQMRRFPNCGAAYRWYSANRVQAEAEAYCESARVYQQENPTKVTLDGAIYRYADWLKNYSPGMSIGAAIIAIKEFCDKEKS